MGSALAFLIQLAFGTVNPDGHSVGVEHDRIFCCEHPWPLISISGRIVELRDIENP